MEDFDQKCSACDGTGRIESGDSDVDALEHEVARIKWEIADLTEGYGLDLRHPTTVPGEAEAREKVGELQIKLAGKLTELEAARGAGGNSAAICPECQGKGFVLTDTGQRLVNFVYRWIHPRR
jgi:predicted methyltransferase